MPARKQGSFYSFLFGANPSPFGSMWARLGPLQLRVLLVEMEHGTQKRRTVIKKKSGPSGNDRVSRRVRCAKGDLLEEILVLWAKQIRRGFVSLEADPQMGGL